MRQAIRKPLSEQAYEQIRDGIVSGELAPGAKLSDGKLADRLGTSRTPVREALLRLADEGLVLTAPSSSTRVAPLEPDEAAQAYPVLAALHALATRLGVPALSARDDDRMERLNERRRAAIERSDHRAAIELDDAFHGVLVEASRNRELARAIDRLLPKIHRLDLRHFASIAAAEVPDDHGPILDACRARDAELASRLVEESFLRLGEAAAKELAVTE